MRNNNDALNIFKTRIMENMDAFQTNEAIMKEMDRRLEAKGKETLNHNTARKWFEGTNMPSPEMCGLIEEVLKVKPGYLAEPLGYVVIDRKDAKKLRNYFCTDLKHRNKIMIYTLIAASDKDSVSFEDIKSENPQIRLKKKAFDEAIDCLKEDGSVEVIDGKYHIVANKVIVQYHGMLQNDFIEKGNIVPIFILKGDRFETEYQGRLYFDRISDAINSDGSINIDCLDEFVSEPFRKYMNNEPISDETRKLIEGALK